MVVLRVVYDARVIILTAAIGFIGAYGAVSTCEQFRLSASNTEHRSMSWLWLVAFAFGGICIWGTHFVGMASFKLMLDDEIEVPMHFDLGNMIYLLVAELFFALTTVYFASTDDCFNRSRKEIMEKFIAHASATYKLNELKHMSQFQMMYIVLTHSVHRPLVSGLISGSSVAAMHYVGMMGLKFQGTISYDGGIVAASCIISIVIIVAAFWIFFRILSMFPSVDMLRFICACNGMLAVSGVHYIGLQAATFHYNPDVPVPDLSTVVPKRRMLVGVTVFSALVVFLMLMCVLADLRAWLLRTSIQLRRAEQIIESNEKLCAGRGGRYAQIARDTTKYMRKYVYKQSPEGTGTLAEAERQRLLYYDFSDEESTGQTNEGRHPGLHAADSENHMDTSGMPHDFDCMSDLGDHPAGGALSTDSLDHYSSSVSGPKPSPRALDTATASVSLNNVMPCDE